MRKLALLLLPEFSNFGLAAVTEPLFVANWLAQDTLFEWHTVSDDGKPVRASNGTVVPVDGDLALAQGCSSVFVLASFEPARTARNRAVVRWLRRIARSRAATSGVGHSGVSRSGVSRSGVTPSAVASSAVEIVGIENGTLALAEAGLLDQHTAAVHWDNLAGFQELFPKIRVAQSLYSFSRNRATCAGAAAILDLMIAWIAQHADVETSAEVARHLLLPGRGTVDPAQTSAARASSPDLVVTRARAIMQSHVDDPLSCEALARQMGLSLRQLERRFKQRVGRTLHSEYMLVRVEKAHQYLQQTGLSVTEVAALTGFSSVEYFSKVYRRAFGVLPSTDRRQSTDAPVFRLKAGRRKVG